MATAPTRKSEISIQQVKNEPELMQALAVREVVFIEEQRVPESIESDAEDSSAYHVLAIDGGHAVGTGRLVMLASPPESEAGRWGQVGRMAVLKSHRRQRIGRRILEALEAEALRCGLDGVKVNAQMHAREFYLDAGYVAHGQPFEEANMLHVEMRRLLASREAPAKGTDASAGSGPNGSPSQGGSRP